MNNNYKNGIKIMSLEGSDILKNNLDGLNIKKDYKAIFPDSLLLDKLLELKLNVSSGTTRDIITLNFNYGYTPKEQFNKTKEIDNLKSEIKEIKKKITKANQDLKRETNKKNKKQEKIDKAEKDIKEFNAELELKIKKQTDIENEAKELIKLSAEDVRIKLYKEGFHLTFYKKNKTTKEYEKEATVFYQFFFRSPSKSRTGEVCFINKELLDKGINNWQRMGLNLPTKKAKLVEMLAYESLTSSHLIDRIIIDPDSILVVNDLESYIEKECACVYADENGCYVKPELTRVKNTIWDGMALGDTSLYHNDCSMYLLRQHFFKCAMFRCKIVEFLKEKYGDEYKTATVKDKYDNDIPVRSIRVITTENAMKFEKFEDIGATFDYWKQKVNEDGNIFGVAKEEHPSKYFTYQRLSYQHINSLPINREQAINLAQDTVDFVNNLKNDDDFFIKYLIATKSDTNSNEMVADLYKHNKNFKNSDFYRTFKSKTISEYKETLKEGKLLVEGDNLTVCGNPYLLLLHAVGEVKYSKIDGTCVLDDGVKDETLPAVNNGVSVYTTRFDNNEKIGMFRNPHNSCSNIALGIVYKHDLMSAWFEFSDNIIAINMIKTDIQDRLNGMDEDSDFCLTTNNKIIVEASERAVKDYLTIVNNIKKDTNPYDNTPKYKAAIDNLLAQGKFDIGVTSNMAQLALSWMWKNKGNKELQRELEDIVAICSVLAQCAIDNSKRKYLVNIGKEIDRIRDLECMQVTKTVGNKEYVAKPYFWQFVKELKEDNKKVDRIKLAKIKTADADGNVYTEEEIKQQKANNLKEFLEAKTQAKTKAKQDKKAKEDKLKRNCLEDKICPMDWIQTAINTIEDIKANQYTGKPKINIMDLIVQDVKTNDRIDKRQVEKIGTLVKELDDMYKRHFDNKETDDEAWESEQMIKTEDTLKNINKIKVSEVTMKYLIETAFTDNSKYTRKLLNCLYKANTERFLNTFVQELE